MSGNVFRFGCYKDELKKKVVISFKVTGYVDDGDLDSYFALTMEKWNLENSNETFLCFRKQISSHIASLKLIFLHQKFIASEVLNLLKKSTPDSIAPVMELIASLSCDLREDFCQYIDDFFPEISRIILENYQNADVLNYCFNCLAHLVYFLRRTMLLDTKKSIKLFLPLLKNKTKHIPSFAAECLAFLLRKIINWKSMLLTIFQALDGDDVLFAVLLREVFRGVQETLHSCSPEVLHLVLGLICGQDIATSLNDKNTTTSHGKTTTLPPKKGLSHILKKSGSQCERDSHDETNEISKLIPCLPFILKKALPPLIADFLSAEQIGHIIKIMMEHFRRFKNSTFSDDSFENLASIFRCVFESIKRDDRDYLEEHIGQAFYVAMEIHPSSTLLDCFDQFARQRLRRHNLFRTIRLILLSDSYSMERQLAFILGLTDWELFDQNILPNLGAFFAHLVHREAQHGELSHGIYSFLLKLSLSRLPQFPEPCGIVWPQLAKPHIQLHEQRQRVDLEAASAGEKDLVDHILISLERHSLVVTTSGDDSEWLLVHCLLYISPLPLDRVRSVLSRGYAQILLSLTNNTMDTPTNENLLTLAVLIETYATLFPESIQSNIESVPFQQVPIRLLLDLAQLSALSDPTRACLALRIVDIIFCSRVLFDPQTSPIASDEITVPECMDLLFPCLRSPSHQIRLHALRILVLIRAIDEKHQIVDILADPELQTQALEQPQEQNGENDDSSQSMDVLSKCLSTERLKLHAQSDREYLSFILHLHAQRKCVRDRPMSSQIALHHLLGLLHNQLTSIWPGLQEAIVSYVTVPKTTAGIRKRSLDSANKTPSTPTPAVPPPPPSNEWSNQVANLYWSVIEPLLLQVGEQVLDSKPDMLPVTAPTLQDTSPSSIMMHLYCLKPDLDQMPAKSSGENRRPINWSAYYMSLWRCLRPMSASRKTRFLTPLLLKLIQHNLQSGFTKSSEQLLLVSLDLFAKFSNIKSIYMERDFHAALFELLTNKRPLVQKAAFQCLLAYRDPAINTYKDNLEKIIDPRNFRDEIRTFKLDVTVANPDHRKQMAPVFLRILYGRLQLSNTSLAPAILTNLAACSADEFGQFLQLLLHPLLHENYAVGTESAASTTEMVPQLQKLRQRVHQTCLGQGSLSWARLQALSKVIDHILDYMGHRLGTVSVSSSDTTTDVPRTEEVNAVQAEVLLRIALCLCAMVQSVKQTKQIIGAGQMESDESTMPHLPRNVQIKSVRSVGVRLLSHLFNSNSLNDAGFWTQCERIEACRHVCLDPDMLQTLLSSSSTSTSHLLLTVALPWSTSPDLATSFLAGPAMETLIRLLLIVGKTNSTVADRIIEIIANLVFSPEVNHVGRALVQPHHPQLIEYLHHRMKQLSLNKTLKLFGKNRTSLRLEREFRLLGYLANPNGSSTPASVSGVALNPSEADQLLNGLLALLTRTTLRRSSARSGRSKWVNSDRTAALFEFHMDTVDSVEAELVRALSDLIQITDRLPDHLTRILHLFARLDSRVCRGLLCQAVGAGVSRFPSLPVNIVEQFSSLSEVPTRSLPSKRIVEYLAQRDDDEFKGLCENILTELNSWEPNRLDQPDTSKREHAFSLLTELAPLLTMNDPPEQSKYLHLGGLSCALHTLNTADLQLRDAALDYCLATMKAIHARPCNAFSKSWPYKLLILNCLWSGLLRLLRQPRHIGSRRLHLLRLLTGIVRTFRKQARFTPLALLADFSSATTDFYTSLQSGTAGRQAHAMRRLALFLRNPLTIASKRSIAEVRTSLNIPEGAFVVPERDLGDFLLPLIQFYLDPQLQSSSEDAAMDIEQKRLMEQCLDAFGGLASHLSWGAYQKLLTSYIGKLKTAGNSDFAARVLITLIDAFKPPSWSLAIKQKKKKPRRPLPVEGEPMDVDDSVSAAEDLKSQGHVLTYMLDVIKKLLPYIARPQKIIHETSSAKKAAKTLRISLVVSLVSLLRRLPPGQLESRLPNLILRVVDVLRPNQTQSPRIRDEAIKSLTRVARMLGPGQALDELLAVVGQQLSRGYACQQVRLFASHKILQEVESAINAGEMTFKSGQLDKACFLLSELYFDELVGSLAEEMDSRRAAGQSLSSISVHQNRTSDGVESMSVSDLGGTTALSDLPEATGLKAPDGLTRLCRLLSPTGLMRLFDDIELVLSSGATGKALKQLRTTDTGEAKDQVIQSTVGCGVRFRARALARLEVTLTRLPTRNGIFTVKQAGCLKPSSLLQVAHRLLEHNIPQVILTDCHRGDGGKAAAQQVAPKRVSDGWTQPRSNLLEPRWKYLEVDSEPNRARDMLAAQSPITQSHLLISCGLHLLVGLIRYRWLELTDPVQMDQLGQCIPLILECMRAKYVRVLGASLRCLNLLFVLVTNTTAKLLPQFTVNLHTAGERLFTLLATHPGLLSTQTAASDVYAQQFAANLYRALASLVRHQIHYPLSRGQLHTLLNSVDIELTRDAATTPSLSLLQAILQRRLRDPDLQKEEADILLLSGDPELRMDVTNPANAGSLVLAKSTDRDQHSTSGAGGGSRLRDLIDRLQHLAITSPSDHIRADARCCLITFLLNYPHKAKFVQSFVAFCLCQLEYKKPTGRLSAVSLLTGLVSDLPMSRIMANQLDEAILVSVGAAIERESVRAIRVGLLALIRLLFARLPAHTAEAHFRDYLLAFISAPVATRSSARLLGLQLVSAILDAQPCLSISVLRPVLTRLLGTDTMVTAATSLFQIMLTQQAARNRAGLQAMFADGAACPAVEVEAARAALEDADWVAELRDTDENEAVVEEGESEDENDAGMEQSADIDASDVDSEPEVMELQEEEEEEDQVEDSDVERESTNFEQAERDARKLCDSLVQTQRDNQTMCRAAADNHYFLVAFTLEYSLRLLHRLVTPTDGENLEPILSLTSLTPVWQALLGMRSTTKQLASDPELHKRRDKYASLFIESTSSASRIPVEWQRTSLLCAGHRGAREWATRCLTPLLKLEVVANEAMLQSGPNAAQSEAVGPRLRSAVFAELQKKRKLRNLLLERLLTESLFQLEHDTKEMMSEEWSTALIANLIYLAQLIHLTSGRKLVLRLFRRANRIALDELNHRPNCYIQRSYTLQLITGLLLRLPRPTGEELSGFLAEKQPTEEGEEEAEEKPTRPDAPAYVTYLRIAARQLAREFRQRERLAFLAAATPFAVAAEDEDIDPVDSTLARVRLSGVRLSKEQSARARSRRKRTQARIRRALMSGTMRPETAQNLVASAAISRARAGPDQLVGMIEATESALTEGLGSGQEGDRSLIQTVCSQASRVARKRQQTQQSKMAVKAALGVAWTGVIKSRDNGATALASGEAKPPSKEKKRRVVDQDTIEPKKKKMRKA